MDSFSGPKHAFNKQPLHLVLHNAARARQEYVVRDKVRTIYEEKVCCIKHECGHITAGISTSLLM